MRIDLSTIKRILTYVIKYGIMRHRKAYENAIVDALENKEDKVILSGFITFKRTKTAKRKFRNFTTKKIEISKGRDIIKILPGSNIKKAM